MLKTAQSRRGIVTAPHHLAAQSGLAVLREGGNAVEAMVAAAATIAVVYPHMTSIGGDAFWLIAEPGREPVAIEACGGAGRLVSRDYYRSRGYDAIPRRGALAANTVAGTLSGWGTALAQAAAWGGGLPLSRLLEDAIHYAGHGMAVSDSQVAFTQAKRAEDLDRVPGFVEAFVPGGELPKPGSLFRQPALARTLARIAEVGPDDFYRGGLSRAIAADLARAGSPLVLEDLAGFRARVVEPLSVRVGDAMVWNLPPPTQGLASLIILALFDRLAAGEADGFAHLHGLVEATKRAYLIRDRVVADPAYMTVDPRSFLASERLDALAAKIDPARALPWPHGGGPEDTIWMGAIDAEGRAVSFIQSIFWEFGSGVMLEDTGILWQNRGSSFSLEADAVNPLEPGRKPFHTLNPALARFDDGRVLAYGCMGGEGQPQTQAAVFSRYARFGQPLQSAVTAPRWLLGRTWGADSTTLKLEDRFDPAVVAQLRAAGHVVELVAPFTDMMGHAGAALRRPDGTLEAAADPRANGTVAAW
ncbi:MAG: gamma-glutamyltransferase [Azospirillum sp.]|nr:gamma-glutamyltransferase [Azospirillum sp.]